MAERISIEEARKVLGRRGETMTGEQVASVINFLYSLCKKTIDGTLSVTKVYSTKESQQL